MTRLHIIIAYTQKRKESFYFTSIVKKSIRIVTLTSNKVYVTFLKILHDGKIYQILGFKGKKKKEDIKGT